MSQQRSGDNFGGGDAEIIGLLGQLGQLRRLRTSCDTQPLNGRNGLNGLNGPKKIHTTQFLERRG